MKLYDASAGWDDGQICSNGRAEFGLFTSLGAAKARCEKDGAVGPWTVSKWSWEEGALVACDEYGWKQYTIAEVEAQE